MKFLKFVLDYESEQNLPIWKPRAEEALAAFLESEFKFDKSLQSYVLALTLSLDSKVIVKDGLKAVTAHLNSMGVFGPGFAAVYPKWGGLSEIAQVGCRAGAVGGGVYMLGSGIKDVTESDTTDSPTGNMSITLTDETKISSRFLVKGSERPSDGVEKISRLVAIVKSSLSSLFETTVEGGPTPAVVVVAFPSDSLQSHTSTTLQHPIYATIHSSDTGECPAGQGTCETFPLSLYISP